MDNDHLNIWLRDVSMPSELMEQLKEIPDSSNFVEPQISVSKSTMIEPGAAQSAGIGPSARWRFPRGRNRVRAGWRLAIAMGMVGLLSMGAWDFFSPAQIAVEGLPAPVPSAAAHSAGQFALRKAEIESLLDEIEIAQLWTEANASPVLLSRFEMETRQFDSYILSLADQASIGFGASVESVIPDMQDVASRFAETEGASIAQQFLAKHSTMNP